MQDHGFGLRRRHLFFHALGCVRAREGPRLLASIFLMLLLGAALAHAPLREEQNYATCDTNPCWEQASERRHDAPGWSGTQRKERGP